MPRSHANLELTLKSSSELTCSADKMLCRMFVHLYLKLLWESMSKLVKKSDSYWELCAKLLSHYDGRPLHFLKFLEDVMLLDESYPKRMF